MAYKQDKVSVSILKYVSGLTKTTIDKIIKYREENGKILSRGEILKKKLWQTPVFWKKSATFLKINN